MGNPGMSTTVSMKLNSIMHSTAVEWIARLITWQSLR